MNCRHCSRELRNKFLDLGFAPPSNAYLTLADLNKPEVYFPLRLLVCEHCWLVQTEDFASSKELFTKDYAYFSSTSSGWLRHARDYCQMISRRLHLDGESFVIEVASNDGYLLKNFVESGIPCLGIEPTESTAAAAEKSGVPVLRDFFGPDLAEELKSEGRQADLIIGNNVYAHVPDILGFTKGLQIALKPDGVISLEFPHLMQLMAHVQFDTVYHEHFSYLSLHVVQSIFQRADLRVWDVEELPTHGGSLRVYGCHSACTRQETSNVSRILEAERGSGLRNLETFQSFQPKVNDAKDALLAFLIDQRRMGKSVAAYGAAAKGNTLLNYAGIKPDLVSFVCDRAQSKQGKFMPGSHIPILAPEILPERRPDFLVILPWNIAAEVKQQNRSLADQGTKFVTAIPSLDVS